MPYKDKQTQKEYQREWIKRKRKGLSTKIIGKRRKKKWDRIKWTREYRVKRTKMAEELIGSQCIICGRKQNLLFHEKTGKKHSKCYVANQVIKNPKNWSRLCHRCHTAVHWLMEFYGLSWEEIISKLQ